MEESSHCVTVPSRMGSTGDVPPAAKNCQTEASQYKKVRGHQLESHLWPEKPAAQLATGSGMADFLRGVTAVYRGTGRSLLTLHLASAVRPLPVILTPASPWARCDVPSDFS
ncbi:hypothetical protein MHYP_G00114220 [Metynnis hypsauchen]